MDGLIKFSDYDIFGYLASGFVILGASDVTLGTCLVLNTNWSISHAAFVIITAYVLGHIAAAFATLVLDRLLVRNLLGRPSDILMRPKTSWWRRWVLSGFLEPLPPQVQKRALERAGLLENDPDPHRGEIVFWRAWPIIKRDPLPYARMESFLRLYGFCRNLSFVSLLAASAFLIRPPAVAGLSPGSKLPFWAALFIALAMFHRYLKFFRAYSAEVFSTYAEPAEK